MERIIEVPRTGNMSAAELALLYQILPDASQRAFVREQLYALVGKETAQAMIYKAQRTFSDLQGM